MSGWRPERVVLYARSATDAREGEEGHTSRQLRSLWERAAREGWAVVGEVADRAKSGAGLDRPGMDRVRELVAVGGVDAVVATDGNRFARGPAYCYFLLGREFARFGTELRSLDVSVGALDG